MVSSKPRHNLPLPLTSFVGRESELDEVRSMARRGRLLTLTGAGGSGKTRLAFEAARSFTGGDFTDGVWFVELDSLREPSLVAREAASVMGVSERPGRDMEAELPEALGESRRLIVLDNCEHLAQACARLAAGLLRRCPNIAILATSREPLGVPGEKIWLVPAMSVPESPSLAAASRSESARLFVERAAAVSHGFALTEANAPAVSEVCRRLDGTPLAIELAASRVASMTVAQISSRLDDALGLLATGPRTAPDRQTTLRAAMDWSHTLLDADEKTLFQNLAVFSGGFTLEAAEEVCRAGSGAPVLDLLSQLVGKSLVRARREGEAARYNLPEVIRQYAVEKLEESGEEEAMRRGHAGFFGGFAKDIEGELDGADSAEWVELAGEDLDNFRAAMSWAAESGEVELGLGISTWLAWFWLRRGRLIEGRAAIERALAVGEGSELSVAKAIHVLGGLAWAQGDMEEAGPLLVESVASLRKLHDYEWRDVWLSSALSTYGLVCLGRGEVGEALAAAVESVDIAREVWDVRGVGESPTRARALAALGLAHMAAGNFDEAREPLEESAALCRRIGDGWVLSFPLGNLAAMSLMAGDYEEAHALADECIRALRNLGDKWLLSVSFSYLAATLAASGRDRRAAVLFGAGEAMREEVGQEEVYAHYRAIHDRGVEAARAALGEEGFAAAWAEGREMGVEAAVSFALEEGEYARPSVPTIHISALGGARVEVGGEAVGASGWRYAKVAELFFYLVSHESGTREGIGLELWPDASPSQLRNAFHSAMHRLRKALGPPSRIHFTSGRYAFDGTLPHTFDARDFEEKVRIARKRAEDDPESAAKLLGEAAELYGGDFLEGFSGGEWILFRQQELREVYIQAMLLLGRILTERKDHSEAARAYRRSIAHDPYSTEAHAGLIRSYARLGERGRALRLCKDLEDTLRDDLGAKPPPEVAELARRLREDGEW